MPQKIKLPKTKKPRINNDSWLHNILIQLCLTCFKFSILDNSVRAQEYLNLQRIIFIARLHPDEYSTDILSEFELLVSNCFTFVDDWNDPIITPDIFRIFSKKLPARHAVDAYISQVKAQLLMI